MEKFEIAGSQLVERVKELYEDATARRVVIRQADGDELMTVPLTVGVVAGGLIARFAPILAALGVIAALFTRLKLEVIREEDDAAEAKTRDVQAEAGDQS